jgi:hypothetical protein
MAEDETAHASLPSFDDAAARAADGPAFSNGTECDAWMANWCYRCVHDDPDEGCPLVLVALLGQTPVEWQEAEPGSLGHQYRCTAFQARGEFR